MELSEDFIRTKLFFSAIQEGNYRDVQKLLFEGVNPNVTDEHGRSGLHMAALSAHQDIFQALLNKEADPDLGDEGGITPLMCACQKGIQVIVDVLLKKGVDVAKKNKGGLSAVFYALFNGHKEVAEKLEQKKPCIKELPEEPIFSIYMKAVTKNWTAVVSFMAERQCDMSYSNKLLVASQAGLCGHTGMLQYFNVNFADKTKDGRSPIGGAVQNGFYDTVKYMLDNGCDVKADKEIVKRAIINGHLAVLQLLRARGAPIFDKDETGATPVQLAIMQGSFEMFKYLVDQGCSLESHEKLGSLALIAASKRKYKVLKYLAEKITALDEVDKNTGETPLLAACQSGPFEAVELLLDKGCNPNVKNHRGVTPALRAVSCKQEEILILLGDRGADLDIPNRIGETAILCAARNKLFAAVRYLADHRCSLTAKDANGNTVASYAVKTNNVALLKFLQQKGVSLDEPDSQGLTPLMRAVKSDAIEAIKLLTSTPDLCSINHRDLNGRTAMHTAVSSNKIEVVKLLKEKGADLSATDHEGNTPLLESLKHKKAYEMLLYLIKNGCDIQATNSKLKGAIHYACKLQKNDALLLLLDEKCPFDVPDKYGLTPFLTSAKQNSESLAIILKAMGADVNNRNQSGKNAVHFAAKNESLKLVLCFCLFGCEIDQEDNKGITPLIIACSKNKPDIVDFLIRKGANVNTVTHEGKTPAHFACQFGSLEILKLLHQENAELDKTDVNGVTPILLAAEKKDEEFLSFLCSQGCDLKRTDKAQRTALHYAVNGNNKPVIRFLIDKEMDPNALDKSGTSPVLLSIKLNQSSILSLFQSKGVMLTEMFDEDSWNAAHFACKTGNLDLLRKLRGKMSMSLTSRTSSEYNCLTIASENGHKEVLKFLLSQKINVNSKNSRSENALHIAARKSHLNLIPLLLESSIRAAEKNADGNNALHILCQKKCSSKIDKFRDMKAEADEKFKELKKMVHEHEGPKFLKTGFTKMLEQAKGFPDVLIKKNFHEEYVSKTQLKEQLKNLLAKEVNPNDQDNQGKGALHYACSDGSKRVLELLLSHGADLNLQDNDGETPIFTAIRSGIEKAVRLLIEKGAKLDVRNNKGQSPRSLAITQNETRIIEILEKRDSPFDEASTLKHATLAKVFKKGNLDHLNFLMKIGFDGKMTENGKTLLHHVVLTGDVRTLKTLASQMNQQYTFIKDIMDHQDKNGDTALHLAMMMGRLDISSVLVNKIGCRVDLKNKKGHPVLHIAAIKNQLAQMQWVFENCKAACQPQNEEPGECPSPLHLVSLKGNLELFKFLEKNGFNAASKCKDGMNCAHYAATSGNWHLLEYMKESNSETFFRQKNNAGHTPLQFAVLNGHEKTASLLYEYDPSLPECIVHQALASGNQHMVDWVEKRNAAMAAVDPLTGETTLRAAVSSGNYHLVRRYANADNLNATNKHGNTPAQQAAARGYMHLLAYLHEQGAQLDIADKDGDTPISDCAINGQLDSMKLLAEYGSDLRHQNAKKRTIVHLACIGSGKRGHLEVVRYAAENELCMDDADDQGNTGLMYACRQGFKSIADFLLNSGLSDPNRVNAQGSTSAHLAALADRSDILDLLSQHGARLDVEDSDGATPLMIAVHLNSLDCVKLLAGKAGPSNITATGRDRLMQLAAYSSPEVRQEVEKLLGVQLSAASDAQERPNRVGLDIDMKLSTYSPQTAERKQYDPHQDANNPFGYSSYQTVIDIMDIKVASLADASTVYQPSHDEDEEENQQSEAGPEPGTETEVSDSGLTEPEEQEEAPNPCQQQ